MPSVSIIPSDSTSMFEVLNNLKITQPDKYQAIVRPNNPPLGLGGFVFDLPLEDGFDMQSDITDHYVENNTAINDQISLKPERVTLRAMVAELVFAQPLQQLQTPFSNPLPLLPALMPDFTIGSIQLQVASAASAAASTNAIVDTQSLYGFFNGNVGSLSQTRQSKAFSYLYQMWKGRQLSSVETPWGVMNDMAIENIAASQGEASKFQSDFAITFKKIRFAKTVTVNLGQLAGRAAQQRADTTQQAKATTTNVTEPRRQSFLIQMQN